MELSSTERTFLKDLFKAADADKDGVIGISDAAFFRKSNLPNNVLGQVRNARKNNETDLANI